MIKHLFWLTLFSLIIRSSICAQSDSLFLPIDTVKISSAKVDLIFIEKLLEDEKYDYALEKPQSQNIFSQIYRWILRKFRDLFDIKAAETVEDVFNIFVIVTALGLLTIFFIKSNRERIFSKKSRNFQHSVSDVHNINSEEDLELALKASMNKKEYKKSIELLFLKALKLLHLKKIIETRPYKSNLDYRNEITNKVTKESFAELSYIFDHIHYGEFPASQDLLNDSKRHLANLENSISL